MIYSETITETVTTTTKCVTSKIYNSDIPISYVCDLIAPKPNTCTIKCKTAQCHHMHGRDNKELNQSLFSSTKFGDDIQDDVETSKKLDRSNKKRKSITSEFIPADLSRIEKENEKEKLISTEQKSKSAKNSKDKLPSDLKENNHKKKHRKRDSKKKMAKEATTSRNASTEKPNYQSEKRNAESKKSDNNHVDYLVNQYASMARRIASKKKSSKNTSKDATPTSESILSPIAEMSIEMNDSSSPIDTNFDDGVLESNTNQNQLSVKFDEDVAEKIEKDTGCEKEVPRKKSKSKPEVISKQIKNEAKRKESNDNLPNENGSDEMNVELPSVQTTEKKSKSKETSDIKKKKHSKNDDENKSKHGNKKSKPKQRTTDDSKNASTEMVPQENYFADIDEHIEKKSKSKQKPFGSNKTSNKKVEKQQKASNILKEIVGSEENVLLKKKRPFKHVIDESIKIYSPSNRKKFHNETDDKVTIPKRIIQSSLHGQSKLTKDIMERVSSDFEIDATSRLMLITSKPDNGDAHTSSTQNENVDILSLERNKPQMFLACELNKNSKK